MKKSTLVILTILMISHNLFAQQKIKIEKGCGFNEPIDLSTFYEIQDPRKDLIHLLDKLKNINSTPGLSVILKESIDEQIDFAAAGRLENLEYIIVNSKILDDNWKTLTILAHELGHIYTNDFLSEELSAKQKELYADRFAGQLLKRLGCPYLNKLLVAYDNLISNEKYPSPLERKKYFKEGWNNAFFPKENISNPIGLWSDYFKEAIQLMCNKSNNRRIKVSFKLRQHTENVIPLFWTKITKVVYNVRVKPEGEIARIIPYEEKARNNYDFVKYINLEPGNNTISVNIHFTDKSILSLNNYAIFSN